MTTVVIGTCRSAASAAAAARSSGGSRKVLVGVAGWLGTGSGFLCKGQGVPHPSSWVYSGPAPLVGGLSDPWLEVGVGQPDEGAAGECPEELAFSEQLAECADEVDCCYVAASDLGAVRRVYGAYCGELDFYFA